MAPDKNQAKGAVLVLVVEDEPHLAAGLKLNLELEGFSVAVAASAREAKRLLLTPGGFAVIILDVMLPDANGMELCRSIRAAGDYTPVIILTVRSSAADRVTGLEAGADDYVTKPFEFAELLARVHSVRRRQSWEREHPGQRASTHKLVFADAVVDFDTHEVQVRGQAKDLTRLELDLLRYFATNAGRVISRGELLEEVWQFEKAPDSRSVDNFVSRLRKTFEVEPSRPRHFLAVRGAGYKFVPDPSADR